MAHMKSQLLEYLIRECVREVLDQVSEEGDETIGAPAPPADGLGTADQPPMEKPSTPEVQPPTPETPETQPTPTTGILLVNPRDKKIKPVPFRYTNDAQLERDLFRLGAALAGSRIQPSLNATRMVKQSAKNPSAPAVYLFLGKDPESDVMFIMATDDVNMAKDNSVESSEAHPSFTAPSSTFDPVSASARDYAQHLSHVGASNPSYEITELKKAIKRIVREVFSE